MIYILQSGCICLLVFFCYVLWGLNLKGKLDCAVVHQELKEHQSRWSCLPCPACLLSAFVADDSS
jgi:hypothetical protein